MWYYNSVVNNIGIIKIARRCRKGSTPLPGISASHALEKIKCIVFFLIVLKKVKRNQRNGGKNYGKKTYGN